MLNHVAISGNLGADPKIKYFEDGGISTTFSLAVSRYNGKDAEGNATYKTAWVNCRARGRAAERIHNDFRKGSRISIHGEFDQAEWTDEQGKKKTMLLVAVTAVDWPRKSRDEIPHENPGPAPGYNANQGGGRYSGQASSQGQSHNVAQARTANAAAQEVANQAEDFGEPPRDADEIPF